MIISTRKILFVKMLNIALFKMVKHDNLTTPLCVTVED